MILAAALALLVADAPVPSPAAGTDASAVAAPSGPTLDPSLVAEVRRVAERVATLRSMTFAKEPLALRSTEGTRKAAADSRNDFFLPSGHAAARGRAWADLGLGDATTPARLAALLGADLPEVSLDAEGRRLLVAPETLPDSDFVSDSKDDPRSTVFLATGVRPDEPLIAHGLVHLLQRQREVPLRALTTDAALAAAAWSEGEANFIAIRFLFQSMGIGDSIFQHDVDPTRVLDGRLVGVAIEALPAVERSFLLFVHQEGFAQVVARYRAGGWKGVELASAQRTTSRDILHPDRAGSAARLELPPTASPLAGLVMADEDCLGEQGVIALVSSRTGKDDLALVAADGWIGDRLLRWEREGGADPMEGVTVWETGWSSEEDAKELAYAIGRSFEDGLAGTAIDDPVEGRKAWKFGPRTARLERVGNRVSLRIASVALDERMESSRTKIEKPTTPPPARR